MCISIAPQVLRQMGPTAKATHGESYGYTHYELDAASLPGQVVPVVADDEAVVPVDATAATEQADADRNLRSYLTRPSDQRASEYADRMYRTKVVAVDDPPPPLKQFNWHDWQSAPQLQRDADGDGAAAAALTEDDQLLDHFGVFGEATMDARSDVALHQNKRSLVREWQHEQAQQHHLDAHLMRMASEHLQRHQDDSTAADNVDAADEVSRDERMASFVRTSVTPNGILCV